jgi:acyl-CoA thioester hydrolase
VAAEGDGEGSGSKAAGHSRPAAVVDVEVRYAETDQMGVVHHSVYVIWFELARTRLCLLSGFHYADIEKQGYYLVVTRTECRFGTGAKYGDTVQVEARLEEYKSRGLRFVYEVKRGNEILASGATEHIWVDRKSGRPCRTPPQLVEPFERAAGLR